MILSTLIMMLFLLALAGTARHFSLPAAKRDELKQLRHDHEELLSWIVACKSNLLTTLPSNTFAVNHYNEKIAGLKDKAWATEKKIKAIEATRWGRASKPAIAPAPPLNPKWDVSVCKHEVIEKVVPSGEDNIVAWICLNPACYEQLELADPAVERFQKKKRIADQWNKVEDWTEADSERARKFLEFIGDDKQAAQYQAHLKGERNAQTVEQAQSFAARTRENEEMARGRRFSTGGIVADQIFVPVRPDLNGIAKDLTKKAYEKKRRMDKKKGGNW